MGATSNIRSYAGYFIKVILVIAVIGLAVWASIATVRFATNRTEDDSKNSGTSQSDNNDARDTTNTEDTNADNEESENDVPEIRTGGTASDSTTQNGGAPDSNQVANTTATPSPQAQEDLPRTGPATDGMISAGLLAAIVSAYFVSKKRLKHALLDN